MRNYTVITSDYGNKPSAGYVSDIIKMVADRDGWYTLDFLGELKPLFNAIDDEDGEIFFMIECPDDVFDFNWKFFGSESEFCNFISDRVVPYCMRFFRYFTHEQNAGLEELEGL